MEKDNIKEQKDSEPRNRQGRTRRGQPAIWILRVVFVLISLAAMLYAMQFANGTAKKAASVDILSSLGGLGDLLRPSNKTATFVLDDVVMEVQVLEQKQKVRAPSFQKEEGTYYLWKTKKGDTVTFPAEIKKDTTYYGTAYSLLESGKAFLLPDENGFVHPDQSISGQDLVEILHLVLQRGKIRTELSDKVQAAGMKDTKELTVGQVLTVMAEISPEEELVAAFTPYSIDSIMTRRQLADVILSLEGRPKKVVFDPYVRSNGYEGNLPVDVDLSAEDAETLLLASMDFTDSEDGWTPKKALLHRIVEPGFYLVGTDLMYAKEDGTFLTNDGLGMLRFDANGAYTSGDSELDQMVSDVLRALIDQHPDASREELLDDAFIYVRDHILYVNRALLYFGDQGWEIEKAKEGLTTATGNCYTYAAEFCMIGRALGYQMSVISGLVLSYQSHGWCVSEEDGARFIYDTELAMRVENGYDLGYNEAMYRIPEDQWFKWNYIWPEGQ